MTFFIAYESGLYECPLYGLIIAGIYGFLYLTIYGFYACQGSYMSYPIRFFLIILLLYLGLGIGVPLDLNLFGSSGLLIWSFSDSTINGVEYFYLNCYVCCFYTFYSNAETSIFFLHFFLFCLPFNPFILTKSDMYWIFQFVEKS